ncbi:NAD+ synthase [Nocardiopsis dassonvillei]|uniref:Glutamine-dependent NAD(+) synthetase n=2 Tax=Nocardiopsis TaxID=2013 RepID=D7B9N3_NOCDD|nr:NAD+ synthase [Nocardiopsis dassonvillei]ADH70891.1 NAD+ synthetase [Nocardiopsis dassonvillei subsp. dassonvillei DSM 43111]
MVKLRIALAQTNPTVGDLEGNCDSVVAYARQASDAGAHLVVFPEMVVTGYSVEDLALRDGFVSASTKATHNLADRLAAEGLGHLPVVVGFLNRREGPGPRFGQPSGAPQNSLAVLHRGRIRLVSAKHHLPNYGVFDEFRYFVPGDTLPVLRLHGVDVAFAICEDLWQDGGPVTAAADAGVGMLVTLNGSPYERHKDDVRLALCQRRAREIGAAIGYVNMTGGQDDLVFEGDSLVVDADGDLVSRAPQFEEALLVTDLSLPPAESPEEPARADGFRVVRYAVTDRPSPPPGTRSPVLTPRRDPMSDLGEVYTALVTGVRDHVRKNGFTSVLVSVSGGADSALTATIAADAVGAENVHALVMPARDSTAAALEDADALIKRQGLTNRVYPVNHLLDALESTIAAADEGGTRNLLAQARGALLMALSREEGHLVLATGDKSELATGLCTHHGDAVGAYAPLKDCWKTLVWELARWRNTEDARAGRTPPIPERSLGRNPVSGWGAPGSVPAQPEYGVLDGLLDAYIGTDQGIAAMTAAGFDPDLVRHVVRLVDRAEHKRRQYPPGPKITKRNLGRDRRLPITSRWLA